MSDNAWPVGIHVGFGVDRITRLAALTTNGLPTEGMCAVQFHYHVGGFDGAIAPLARVIPRIRVPGAMLQAKVRQRRWRTSFASRVYRQALNQRCWNKVGASGPGAIRRRITRITDGIPNREIDQRIDGIPFDLRHDSVGMHVGFRVGRITRLAALTTNGLHVGFGVGFRIGRIKRLAAMTTNGLNVGFGVGFDVGRLMRLAALRTNGLNVGFGVGRTDHPLYNIECSHPLPIKCC